MSGVQFSELDSFKKLKRLMRYVCGMPRLVHVYKWQGSPSVVDIYVDTDFAGCRETRRSTSGGAVVIGGYLVKHWSKTQTTISLSSGESELHGTDQNMAISDGRHGLETSHHCS